MAKNSANFENDVKPFFKPLFGARFPTRFIPRYGRYARAQFNLRDPYKQDQKERFEDAARADPVVRTAFVRLAQFTLGRRTFTNLDVIDDYPLLQQLIRKNKQKGKPITKVPPKASEKLQDQAVAAAKRREILTAALQNPSFGGGGGMGGGAGGAGGGPGAGAGAADSLSNFRDFGRRAIYREQRLIEIEQEINLIKQQLTAYNELENYDPDDETKPLDIEALKRKAIEVVMSDQEYLKMKNTIDRINSKVGLRQKLIAAFIQAKIGGRAALEIGWGKVDGQTLPVDLRILNWLRLGQIEVNEKTWAFERVQYLDLPRTDEWLEADEIIYFPHFNIHISPNTMWYGLSALESVAHVSEDNRLIDEEDLKELNRSLWAAFGLLKFETKNEAEISKFLDDFKPGTWTGTNIPVEAQIVQLATELRALVDERNENDRRILRGLGVPNMLVGFEDVQNRATAQNVLLAWKESVLTDERTWIRDIVEPQWLDSITAIILNEKNPDKIPVKVKLEFEEILLETFADNAKILLQLYKEGVIPLEKLLKSIGFDDVIEEVNLNTQNQLKARLLALESHRDRLLEFDTESDTREMERDKKHFQKQQKKPGEEEEEPTSTIRNQKQLDEDMISEERKEDIKLKKAKRRFIQKMEDTLDKE